MTRIAASGWIEGIKVEGILLVGPIEVKYAAGIVWIVLSTGIARCS